jgi:hypothetical protein
MSDIKKRYSGILELDKELWTGRPVFQKPAKPSCKEELQKVFKWHFGTIVVFASIMFVLGGEFLRPNSLMTLMICGAVCWIASLWLTLSVVMKKFKADVDEYVRVVERQKKIEEAHDTRLFQYLDKAMAEYWKASAPKPQQEEKKGDNESEKTDKPENKE